jgi:alpha-muurolene/germacrene-A/gamma-muurolene/(+)-delta-cadinol synthase
MDPSPSSSTTIFRIPDIISHCPFKPIYHKNGDALAAASDNWVAGGCRVLTENLRRHLHKLKAGKLAAFCYNECSDDRLRVACDILNVLWLLDDLSEGLKASETENLADIIMNALTFPQFYKPTHAGGREQPEEESDVSRLTRE